MDRIWEYLTLIFVNVIICGIHDIFVACDDSRSSEFNQSKPITNVHDFIESTTESFVKKKNVIADWKNNNILRDKDTHSFVTENVKSLLDDIMKNGALNKSDATSTNLEHTRLSMPYHLTTISSIDHVENPFLNVPDTLPRNTRDLIPDSGNTSNGTDIATDNSTVPKENTSVGLDRNNKTLFVPALLPDKILSNRTVIISNQTNATLIISPPPFVKNPKDKASKPKMDMNSKQFKKPSNSLKNKSNVIPNYNVTIEAIKPENTSEYITDEPTDDNITVNNLTHIVEWNNGTAEHDSSNATLLSLRTPPEAERWQPLSIILLVTGAIALISIVIAMGMFSVVLYRRYQWNKPQTFSDKCSNADSTGYIDDSTLKENSEEMYSLDNDSFLNSLEAMTIQNYWADSIRHTKL